jgi:hypothetical protein
MDVGGDEPVITFSCNKCFELIDIGQRRLEQNAAIGRKGKASSVVIPTIHGSFHSQYNGPCMRIYRYLIITSTCNILQDGFSKSK